MILVIDGQTDKLLGELNNRGNQLFWDDIRRHELTGLHTFNFTMLADSPMAEKLEKRNKFLTPKKGGGYYEFIIYDTETIYSTNEKIINGVATYAELNKQRIMNPYSFNSMTLKQLVDLSLIHI